MAYLSNSELLAILDYVDEIEAVIEADDGTLVPMPLLEKHEVVRRIVNEVADRD